MATTMTYPTLTPDSKPSGVFIEDGRLVWFSLNNLVYDITPEQAEVLQDYISRHHSLPTFVSVGSRPVATRLSKFHKRHGKRGIPK